MTHYAHSLPHRPQEEWEPLERHLRKVAGLAEQFAARFGAGPWGKQAGLWHDLGKYSAAFQDYLIASSEDADAPHEAAGRVDHSTAGAQHAARCVPGLGRVLAYAIAGHHAGLADASVEQSSLDARLSKQIELFDPAPENLLIPLELPTPSLSIDRSDPARGAFQLALFTRMLFSALVDADFLATEEFMSPNRAAERSSAGVTLDTMQERLDAKLASFADVIQSEVNRCRAEVLAACRGAAKLPPDLFSLTVPTGGGKTLASLAFALEHARANGLDRIVYAIPFTSIIEQTARVFREVFQAFGDDAVLEHHTNLDPDSQSPRGRLAAENWESKLIVTTNVQLFESLFASKTSRCRKLHRLARSVIILDEAQTLPVELLRPCLVVLRELVADYRATVVLCTATQPALGRRDEFPIGLRDVREIIPEPERLYRRMKRVEVRHAGELTDQALCEQLHQHEQFLAIVNTRAHASRLFGRLAEESPDDGMFHLSTLMCGEHRAEVIEDVRRRLAAGERCRVVSTQLIEAGVDIDFPVVYRAMAGVDSIAQAAGRCNREGRSESAAVWLFEPTDVRLRGYLASTAHSAREVLPDFPDPLEPSAVEAYFRLHYWKQQGEDRWDEKRVMQCFPTPVQRLAFNFRTAAERFRIIDDATMPVFVPYGERGTRLVEELRENLLEGPLVRGLLRRLQRYTVGLYPQVYASMIGADIEEQSGGYAVLINADVYDDRLGLRADLAGMHEPESLMC